jgi:hypothetical protein
MGLLEARRPLPDGLAVTDRTEAPRAIGVVYLQVFDLAVCKMEHAEWLIGQSRSENAQPPSLEPANLRAAAGNTVGQASGTNNFQQGRGRDHLTRQRAESCGSRGQTASRPPVSMSLAHPSVISLDPTTSARRHRMPPNSASSLGSASRAIRKVLVVLTAPRVSAGGDLLTRTMGRPPEEASERRRALAW